MKPKENYAPGSPKDLCGTPGYALEPLLEAVGPWFIGKYVWECASGEGLLANAMLENDIRLSPTTDIQEGFDFLADDYEHEFDCIVTNPPFSQKHEFMYRCVDYDKPWALLMPAETVANKWYIEWAREAVPQPGIVWVSPRINFKMPEMGWKGSGSQFNKAWFTWGMLLAGNYFYRADHWTKEYRQRFEH